MIHKPSPKGVSVVCSFLNCMQMARSWSEAASDNHLWQLIYTNFFGTSLNSSNDMECSRCTSAQNAQGICREETSTATSVDWKNAFKRAYKGTPETYKMVLK